MNRIVIIIAMALFVSSCGETESKANDQEASMDRSTASITEIVGIGKVVPQGKIVNLAATSGGIVTQVFKNDGDTVVADEKLVQLENETELLKIAEIESQITSQRSQINLEENNVKDAKLKLKNKKELLISTKNLVNQGAETQQVYDDLKTEVNTLEVALEKAKLNVQKAERKLQEIGKQLKSAKAEAAKKTLKAPDDGRILNMNATQGAALNQYATYAKFAPAGPLMVKAEVDELFSQKLKIGQQVVIRHSGSQEAIATGEVKMLSPYLQKKSLFSAAATDQEDRRVREIWISIKDDKELVINSKVECVIKL